MIKIKLTRLTAMIMMIVTVLSIMTVTASAEEAKEMTGSNWMSFLPDDKPLNEISIPGAHDATAANVRWGMGKFAQTQDRYIDEMLKDGVRYFDLRLYRDKNEFYMCHKSVNCRNREGNNLKLSAVINDMESFLDKNPDETVILQITCDRSGNDANKQAAKYFINLANKGRVYCGNTFPTLGQARGKFVILSRLNLRKETTQSDLIYSTDGDEKTYWAFDVHDFKKGDEKNITMTKTADTLGCEVWTEDEFDVTKNYKWSYVSGSLTGKKSAAVRRDEANAKGKKAWSIIYASMSRQSVVGLFFNFKGIGEKAFVWPEEGAKFINPKLKDLLKKNSDLFTGCLVCDYINKDLASLIYKTNFN